MEKIQIKVAEHGAELRSVCREGREYMWNADKAFWGRVSPMLFPVVGKPADDTLRIGGKPYEMHQHGFARDEDFVKEGDAWVYRQETPRENYPYTFEIVARYPVENNRVTCEWTVRNTGGQTMHFQIGAHPAFLLPNFDNQEKIHGYLKCYNSVGEPIRPLADSYLEGGLRIKRTAPVEVLNEDGLIVLTDETFAADAFLLEGSRVASVALLDPQKREVLRVGCPQAEAWGLWAPHKPGCPFVCIEPWCGIADWKGFAGSIEARDCNHSLAPGAIYRFAFTIELPA